MKVLFIASSGVLGGATKSFLELVQTIQQLDESIHITVCTSEHNQINEVLADSGIKSFADGHMAAMEVMPRLANKYRYFRRHIKRSLVFYYSERNALKQIERHLNIGSFDLIHTNSARDDIGCLLSRKYKLPHIMHIREFGTDDFDCWLLRFNYYKFINKHVDRFVSISNAVKESWVKRGINSDKVSIIYNGVDSAKIEKIDYLYQSSEKLKMVITGGICQTKGQYQIIEAIYLLPAEIKQNIYLDMYGWSDNEYIEKLFKRIYELGLEDNISWCGVKDNVYSVLKNYDVGLICSVAEGFGRVTAEYMHAGLGIIASNTGANPELVEDGFNGLVYILNDYHDLANKILLFYNNRKLLKKCGINGYLHANMNYTKEINAKRVIETYRELVSEECLK